MNRSELDRLERESHLEQQHGVEFVGWLVAVLLAGLMGFVITDWATGDRDIRDVIARQCK